MILIVLLILASLARPPARHPPVAGFRLPFVGPPCIHEAHFRHRGASVSGSLRPSATVAAWQPGPAAPVRGKASIPPGVAGVHPCPENVGNAKFSAIFFGVNRPGLPPSPIRITPLVFTNQTNCKKAATAPEASGSGRSRRLAAPPTVSPISPPTHQR